MTREEKDLLLKDICARLPYGMKVSYNGVVYYAIGYAHDMVELCRPVSSKTQWVDIDEIKPYLRPMTSMSDEEKEELLNLVLNGRGLEYFHVTHDGSIDGNQKAEQDLYNFNLHWINFGPLTTSNYVDYLNKKMFDYRGLIPKGLADYAEEGMYRL